MHLRLKSVAPVLACALALAGCGRADQGETAATAAPDFPVTVETCGQNVTFDQPAQRAFVRSGLTAQLVVAAGAGDKIVAFASEPRPPLGPAQQVVDDPRVQRVPDSGTLSLESIIGTDPDVVITWGLTELPPTALADAGIKTVFVRGFCSDAGFPVAGNPSRFGLIYQDIETYGAIFGTSDVAEKAVSDLRKRVEAVQQRFAGTPARSAAVLAVGTGGIGTYGNQSMVHEQMNILGLRNAFGDQEGRYNEVNIEEIIDSDPDVLIFVCQTGAEEACRTQENSGVLAGTKALRNGSVVRLNSVYILDGSTFAFDGLEQMATQLEQLG